MTRAEEGAPDAPNSSVSVKDVLKVFVAEWPVVVDGRAARPVKVYDPVTGETLREADTADVLAKLLERERIETEVQPGAPKQRRPCDVCGLPFLPRRKSGAAPKTCARCMSKPPGCDECGTLLGMSRCSINARKAQPRPWLCRRCLGKRRVVEARAAIVGYDTERRRAVSKKAQASRLPEDRRSAAKDAAAKMPREARVRAAKTREARKRASTA